MILALNTSTNICELFLYKGEQKVKEYSWEAGRRLSIELLPEITKLLSQAGIEWKDLGGVVVFEGPGSFTGLRIGVTTANTIAYSLGVPVAAGKGNNWLANGQSKLKTAKAGEFVAPEYGSPPRITLPEAK